MLGTARLLLVIEEHGAGRQHVRLRLWPMAKPAIFLVACLFAGLAMRAALDLEWNAWALLNIPAIFLVGRTMYESAGAMAALRQVIGDENECEAPHDSSKRAISPQGQEETPDKRSPANPPPNHVQVDS